MGKLAPFISGRLVAFDTAPLIYYIEENPVYLSLVDELFDTIDSGASTGITSVLREKGASVFINAGYR